MKKMSLFLFPILFFYNCFSNYYGSTVREPSYDIDPIDEFTFDKENIKIKKISESPDSMELKISNILKGNSRVLNLKTSEPDSPYLWSWEKKKVGQNSLMSWETKEEIKDFDLIFIYHKLWADPEDVQNIRKFKFPSDSYSEIDKSQKLSGYSIVLDADRLLLYKFNLERIKDSPELEFQVLSTQTYSHPKKQTQIEIKNKPSYILYIGKRAVYYIGYIVPVTLDILTSPIQIAFILHYANQPGGKL